MGFVGAVYVGVYSCGVWGMLGCVCVGFVGYVFVGMCGGVCGCGLEGERVWGGVYGGVCIWASPTKMFSSPPLSQCAQPLGQQQVAGP